MAKVAPKAIEVTLRYADESQAKESVKGDDPKVRDLKNQIAEEFQADGKDVVLRYNNTELVDDEPLCEIFRRAERPTIDVVIDSKQYFPTRIFATQDRASNEKHDGRVRPLPEERVYARQSSGTGRPTFYIGDAPLSSLYKQRGPAKDEKQKPSKGSKEKPLDLSGKSVWFTVFCCPYEKLPLVVRHFSEDGRDIIRVVTYRNDIVSLEFAKGWGEGWHGEEMQVQLVAERFAVVLKRGRYVPDMEQRPGGPTLELGGGKAAADGPNYEWVEPAPRKGFWETFVDFLKGFFV
jgi:hypothetical protein